MGYCDSEFLLCVLYMYVCVQPGIQSEDQNQFFTFKVRTFWQSEVKISVLALWLCALSSLFHNMGVGGYGRNPLFVRARHVQRCVKKCPHFECVIHRFVLALNAWTNTLYTRVYIVSSLWMPGQVGVCRGMYVYVPVWLVGLHYHVGLPLKSWTPITTIIMFSESCILSFQCISNFNTNRTQQPIFFHYLMLRT